MKTIIVIWLCRNKISEQAQQALQQQAYAHYGRKYKLEIVSSDLGINEANGKEIVESTAFELAIEPYQIVVTDAPESLHKKIALQSPYANLVLAATFEQSPCKAGETAKEIFKELKIIVSR